MTDVASLWVYLAETPLLWLFATLVAYLIGDAAFQASGRAAPVNPVLVSVLLIGGALTLTQTPYETYFEGAQFVHFLLGPATIALAVPLWANRAEIRRAAVPMAAALIAGSTAAILSAIAIAAALGAGTETLLSLAPKSATAPIAMGIAEEIGGVPALTAVLVIMTGVTGAVAGPVLLTLMRVRDQRARGFAIGVAAHGIGAARAFQDSPRAGAFAGVAMGLNGLLTALIAPFIVSWLI